jgi:hypothetical protein
MRLAMLMCALGLTACVTSSGSDSDKLTGGDDVEPVDPDHGDDHPEVCEVEPDGIGVLGEVPTHGTTLEVTKWVAKSGSKDAFVGFTLSRQARFTVLVGTKSYKGEGTSWMSPQGVTGAAVTGIDFCDDYCEDEGVPELPPVD